MDTSKAVTHIGLCAGYGGIELGLKRVLPDLRTVALCEIEAYACANLVAKMEAGLMDAAPIWTDVKTFPWGSFRDRVDILTGGYPCQPFSNAGKQLGTDDPRHLWPYIAVGIRAMQPRLCFFENVEGHISLGLATVISDLEDLGYKTTWGIFSASEVGAPHQRRRIFILAHSLRERGQFPAKWKQSAEQVPGSEGTARRTEDGWICTRCGSDVFDGCGCDHNESQCPKCGEWTYPFVWESTDGCSCCGADWPKWSNTESWAIEPTVCRDDDGYSSRVDRLRLLGNGVVPATAELAFKTLLKELTT